MNPHLRLLSVRLDVPSVGWSVGKAWKLHFLAPIGALVFCRFGDLSKEAMIQAIKDKDLRFLQVIKDLRFLHRY